MYRLLFVLVPCLAFALPPEVPRGVDLFGDALPEGAAQRLGTVRLRQPFAVNCLAMSPDGKTLLAGTYSNKIFVWDVESGKLRTTWPISSYAAYSLQYISEGREVLLSGGDGAACILDAATGQEKRRFLDPQQQHGYVGLTLSPDQRTLVMMHRYEQQVVVWDLVLGAIRHRFTNMPSYYMPHVAFTPDSKQLILLWSDNRLHLVDVISGKSVRCLEPSIAPMNGANNQRIGDLALFRDGKTLIYRSTDDSTYHLIDVETAKPLRSFSARTGESNYYSSSMTQTLMLTSNERFLFDAGCSNGIRVWGLASGKLLRTLVSPSGNIIYHMAVSADGKRVAGTTGGHVISLWDVEAGELRHLGIGHDNSVARLLFSHDGRDLFTIGYNSIRRWNLATGREDLVRRSSMYGIEHLKLSPDDKELRWVASDRAHYRWKVDANKEPEQRTRPSQTQQHYSTFAVSPDGKLLAGIHYQERKLKLVHLLENKPDRELLNNAEPHSNSLGFSPDGRILAFGQRGGGLTLFDVETGTELRKISPQNVLGPSYYLPNFLFSPDSRSILLFDRELRIVETLTGNTRVRFTGPGQSSSPSAMAFSWDWRLVGRGTFEGQFSVLDTWTGEELVSRNTEQGQVVCLAFSKDGRRLATGGSNTTALIWDLPPPPDGSSLRRFSDAAAWEALASSNAMLAFEAMVHFLSQPELTPRWFREQFRPSPSTDPARIQQWIRELDDESYAVRERAFVQLLEARASAQEQLRLARRSLSLEVKRRAEDLYLRLGEDGLEDRTRLRALRAVEVLGRLSSSEARQTLRHMLTVGLGPVVEKAVRETLAWLGETV